MAVLRRVRNAGRRLRYRLRWYFSDYPFIPPQPVDLDRMQREVMSDFWDRPIPPSWSVKRSVNGGMRGASATDRYDAQIRAVTDRLRAHRDLFQTVDQGTTGRRQIPSFQRVLKILGLLRASRRTGRGA